MLNLILAVALTTAHPMLLEGFGDGHQGFPEFKGLADVPVVNSRFCTEMVDSLFVNGSTTPSQQLNYTLCIDLQAKSWANTAAGKPSFYFNGTHIYEVQTDGTCTIKGGSPDPTKSMPFTMILIDANATKNGTAVVDGETVDVWTHHREFKKSGPMVQPAEDMYVNGDNQLVRGECQIKQQKGYPMTTKAYHDYFSATGYNPNPPKSAFRPAPGTNCTISPGQQPFVDATCNPECAAGSKCCAETKEHHGICFKVDDCAQIHG